MINIATYCIPAGRRYSKEKPHLSGITTKKDSQEFLSICYCCWMTKLLNDHSFCFSTALVFDVLLLLFLKCEVIKPHYGHVFIIYS